MSTPDLSTTALVDAGGGHRSRTAKTEPAARTKAALKKAPGQANRMATKPITVHYPGNVRAYVRRSGNYFLMIEPGTKFDRKTGELGTHGFPYGSYPRLVCSYIALNVRLKRSRRVFLGDSLSAFMGKLGLVPTGGRWGTIQRPRVFLDT